MTSPGLLDLLLPRPCAVCGAVDGPWCARCRHVFPVGLLLRDGSDGGVPVAAATTYTDDARRLLLAYKEQGRHELAVDLGVLLARAVVGATLAFAAEPVDTGGDTRAADACLWLVPVPSRPRSRRQRGADVGLLLARRAAAELRRLGRDAAVAPLLRHARGSTDQVGLGRDDRGRNVAGTLRARPAPGAGRPTLVVTDDIVTTGATLAEASRALVSAGWPMTGGAVVADTPGGRVTPLETPPEGR